MWRRNLWRHTAAHFKQCHLWSYINLARCLVDWFCEVLSMPVHICTACNKKQCYRPLKKHWSRVAILSVNLQYKEFSFKGQFLKTKVLNKRSTNCTCVWSWGEADRGQAEDKLELHFTGPRQNNPAGANDNPVEVGKDLMGICSLDILLTRELQFAASVQLLLGCPTAKFLVVIPVVSSRKCLAAKFAREAQSFRRVEMH